MKDVDEAVERVLRGMGGVEAPEGMERRVLARVEAAAAVRESRFGGGFAGVRWAGLGLAAAVLLMVVGGLAWRERAGRGAMAVVMVPAASTRTAPRYRFWGRRQFRLGFRRRYAKRPQRREEEGGLWWQEEGGA